MTRSKMVPRSDIVRTSRTSLLAATLVAVGGGCSSSSPSASGGGPDASVQTAPDGSTMTMGQDGSSDTTPSGDASTDAAEGGALATEPAYLRTDAIGGFTYTNNFGTPYDSILGAALNTTQSALAPGYSMDTAAGQLVSNQRFVLIANSSDLYNALDISASLSVSSGLANVNAKTEFAKSTTIDTDDLWILADLTQSGASQRIVNPTLSAQAAALSPGDFYALYGDRYAAEIMTGAEMFCTVQIHTSSQLDKSNLTASLGFSYGTSSVSTMFSSTATSAIANHTTNVYCNYLGFTPTATVTDLTSLLAAANAFSSNSAGSIGNIGTSSLYIAYTSYYGIPGYPGVPVGTDIRVAQQQQLASDYLLYDSLVNNDFAAYFADSSYASQPFFADMKAYRDGLQSYLTATISNSQNPGVTPPTSSADGVITDWTTTQSLVSPSGSTPQYTVYSIANGIVPKRISDFAIPLRYAYPSAAGVATLDGVTFTPITPVQPFTTLGTTSPIDYPLYFINKPGAGYVLEYEWDTGTYFFPNIASNNLPSASLVNAAIANVALTGNETTDYVVVSKANGLVMTDNVANPLTVGHLTYGSGGQPSDGGATGINSAQLWKFYLDSGGDLKNCSSYVAPPAGDTPGVNCAQGNNGITTAATPPCGSLLYGMSELDSGYWEVSSSTAQSAVNARGGGGCADCNWNCSRISCPNGGPNGCGGGPVPTDDFFLQPYNSNTDQAIYNYAGSNSGAVSYIVTASGQTSPTASSESVVVGGPTISGYANELWVFVPVTNVDQSP